MTDLAATLTSALSDLFSPFVEITSQRSVYSFLGAYLFLMVFILIDRLRRGEANIDIRAVLRLAFNRRVWLHPSALLDYKLYIVNAILLTFVLGLFMVGSGFWADYTGRLLEPLFGKPDVIGAPHWSLFIPMIAVQILSLDFGYWLGHFAFHKIDFLWEFHKVHHSAEVMTPATEMRQHPVELVGIPIVIGFTTGISYALFVAITGTTSQEVGIIGTNIILCAHMLTFHHLRHSHINMPFTGFLGKLLHSPAHHQIHHSDNPAHFDRNMGYLFSIWDWFAGTLYVPKLGEKINLGIGHEGAEFNSVGNSLWYPCKTAFALIAAKLARLTASGSKPPIT